MATLKTLFVEMTINLGSRGDSASPMNAIDAFIDSQPEGSFATFQYRENKADPGQPHRLLVQINISVNDRVDAADAFSTLVNSSLLASGAVVFFDSKYKERLIPEVPTLPEE
jgi:hypothetical protein